MQLKHLKRGLINSLLVAGLLLAFYLIIKASILGQPETIAASLAVIAAIIATWISQKVVWKQEDDLEPEIIVYFDLDSYSKATQLVMKNIGGSNAFDVKLNWIT